jgi:hypothetical protein
MKPEASPVIVSRLLLEFRFTNAHRMLHHLRHP